MSQDPLYQKTRHLLSQGNHEQAQALAAGRRSKDVCDPTLHLAWAELLEELGLVEEVILELNLAIRDDPERLETYRRLAEIYLDQGQPLKAAQVWGALVKRRPQEPQAYGELGRALEEAGGSSPGRGRPARPVMSAPAPPPFKTTCNTSPSWRSRPNLRRSRPRPGSFSPGPITWWPSWACSEAGRGSMPANG